MTILTYSHRAIGILVFMTILFVNTGWVSAQPSITYKSRGSYVGVDSLERQDSGFLSATSMRQFDLPQIDPLVFPTHPDAELKSVMITIFFGQRAGRPTDPGNVDFGVYPRGAGGGTVDASAVGTIDMLFGSASFGLFESVTGSHTGFIDGDVGIGSSSVSTLLFSESETRLFTSAQDLALFTGTGFIDFETTLTTEADVTVIESDSRGPNFGFQSWPNIAAQAEVVYAFSVPEPGSGLLLATGFGLLAFRRRRAN